MEILFYLKRRTSGRLPAYNSGSGVNPKEIDAKLCPKRDGIPSPACRNQMAEPSPGIISRNRCFSSLFAVFCPLLRENVGSQALNRAQLLFLLQNSFCPKIL